MWRVEIKNKHCFKWLRTFTERLKSLHSEAVNTFKYTDANIRIERIESHFNKCYETYYIEYTNFATEKRTMIKIVISEFKLTKNKHSIY